MRAGRIAAASRVAAVVLASAAFLHASAARAQPTADAPRGAARPDDLRIVLAGRPYRIPREYVFRSYGDERGFNLSLLAATLEPYSRCTTPNFPRDFTEVAFDVWADVPRDGPAVDGHAWTRINFERDMSVLPAERSEELPGPGDGHVPLGLALWRALPETRPNRGQATRKDMLVPEEALARPGRDGVPSEAILCASPLATRYQQGWTPPTHVTCEHVLAARGMVLSIRYERRHLPRWREMRDGFLTLLDGWAVAAAPPPAR